MEESNNKNNEILACSCIQKVHSITFTTYRKINRVSGSCEDGNFFMHAYAWLIKQALMACAFFPFDSSSEGRSG